jgi:cytidylate kinase
MSTGETVVVAIDGPAGAGKSTVAREVARRLEFVYIDTGAMYRAVAALSMRAGLPIDDDSGLTRLAQKAKFEFRTEEGAQRLFVDGEDFSVLVRTPEVTELSSPVSSVSGVRRALVQAQRAMAEGHSVVMEGRDVQTVIFPNAGVKVYLDADPQERARRRHAELAEKDVMVPFDEVLEDIEERDVRDSTRDDSPLRAASDATVVDTTDLSVDQVVDRILDIVNKKVKVSG